MPDILIRPETPADAAAISALTTAAFANAEHSDGTEAQIIERLRAADALLLSLVAIQDGHIIGHAAYSDVTVGGQDLGWVGLGPVSVAPTRQAGGIGSALIREGLSRLKTSRKGCVVLGDPGYYARFGFAVTPGLTYPGVLPEYFMALRWDGAPPQGEVAYQPGFTG